MSSKLIASPLYHPSGGINLDANGVVARPNECIDGVNIDIDTDRVVRRKGTKAFPIPTEIGAVIKFHRYIHPTRGALLFAFCANSIYQYSTTYGWQAIYFGTSFSVNSWSVTDVIDKEFGSTVVAAGCTYTRPTEGYSDAGSRVLLIYDTQNFINVTGLYPDPSNTLYGYTLVEGVAGLTSGSVLEIQTSISTGNNGVIASLSNSSGSPQWIAIYKYSNTEIRACCGAYGPTSDYVSMTVSADTVYSVKVNGAGEVYLNGVYQGLTGNTITGTGTDPLRLWHGLSGGYGGCSSKIFKIIIDGTILIADENRYFYDISDSLSRVFPQFNSFFSNSGTTYQWTVNPTTAGEYYLELNGGGDPGLVEPTNVRWSTDSYALIVEGTALSAGTINSLAADEWAWGTDGTIGFNTVFAKFSTWANPSSATSYQIRIQGDDTTAYTNFILYYDSGETIDIAFIDMDLKKNLYDDETYDLTSGPASSDETITAPGIDTYELTTNRVIVTGSAYLVVEGIGVVATASLAEYVRRFGTSPNYEERLTNRWVPVDENEIAYGEDSYIDLTTGDFSVEWLLSTYNGLELTIYYQYESDVTYKPLHVSNYHNALILANTAEFYVTSDAGAGSYVYTPWRVRWSDQGNIRLFKELNYQDLALDDITPILGMRSLETAASSTIIGPLYFLKHNSIVRGTYNQSYNLYPDTPVPMFNFEVALSEGMESTNTVANVGNAMFYLGRNDVYAFDGVNRVSLTKDGETGNTRIQRHLIKELNINYLYRNFGLYDEVNRKYYLFVVLNTSSTNYPEDCFVYDIDRRYWVRHTYSQVSAAIETEVTFEGTIDGLSGQVDNLSGTIDDLTNNASKSLLFSIGNYTYYATEGSKDEIDINDTEFTSYFITRDFLSQTLENTDRVQRVVLEAKGGTIDIAHSAYYDTDPLDFNDSNTLTFGNRYDRLPYNCDEVTTAIRFMVTLGIGSEFRWLQVFSNRQELIGE